VLDVVGGVSFEFCVYPAHRTLLGSGGRAVAALAQLSAGLRLHSVVEPSRLDTLRITLGRGPIEIRSIEAPSTLSFSYLHVLSNPDIRSIPPVSARPRIEADGKAVLRFGMLDAIAVTTGHRVVYDPQSPDKPEPYTANGSSAQELAYVCNLQEAWRLTGGTNVEEAGRRLLTHPNVRAVVIKEGPRGAHWFSDSGAGMIPASPTEFVFKIGSGDVFSAVFAHCWAELGMDVSAAVGFASLGAAHYCRFRALPLPGNLEALQSIDAGSKPLPEGGRTPRIYLAAPFFTLGQRWLLEETRSALKDMGADVFSPLHDVGTARASSEIAEADLAGLRKCTAVLGLVDGLDAGTIFELGYARAIGIPVVTYADHIEAAHATMLAGTGCELVEDYGSAVYRAFWRSEGR
jgi:hypothetical protein